MGALTLFDVLFEKWRVTDQTATDAWLRVRAPRTTADTYFDDLMAAMRLQHEAVELLEALRAELHKERQQVPVI